MELEDLMELLTDALVHFYTNPANFMPYVSSEGGYLGDYEGPWEKLEALGLSVKNTQLNDDIYNSLDHSSAWADEQVAEYDFKYEGWHLFKHHVKHQSRFLFSSVEDFRIGRRQTSAVSLLKELTADIRKQRMLTRIKAGTPIYRCRQHREKNEISEMRHICSPAVEFAIYPNRMSSAGVSMFYGAFQKETAILETLYRDDKDRPYYTIAEFSPINDLEVIDLTKIPYVSPFDRNKRELYDKVEFLSRFLDDFSKPISHDGREHIEYVPTQVVTEYFRYKFIKGGSKGIDGIIYPSSKDRRSNACVLFMNHQESLERLKFNPRLMIEKWY